MKVRQRPNLLTADSAPDNVVPTTGQNSATKRNNDWFFGLNGIQIFAIATAFVLVFCFVDMLLPIKLISTYIKHIAVNCLIYAILAMGLNFVSGYIGQTSLGHAAFFGIGAYATGLMVLGGVSFWFTIPIAAIIAALFSIPMAAAAQRVRGSFLVVITYGFGEVLRYICINTEAIGASSGLPGIATPTIFGNKLTKIGPTTKDGYILLCFVLVCLVAFFVNRVERSRVGYAFHAIREDEIAALSMGIDVNWYKMLAIILSAVICSIAGSVQAVYATFVSPEILSSTQSILILTIVIVGGKRSIKGAILGAIIMTILPEIFHSVQELFKLPFDPWMILYGLILVIMMRYLPQGFWGKGE